MIVVALKGGLGNQMFQYAFARHLASRNEDELRLDIYSLTRASDIGNIYRPFSLNLFNTKGDLATPADIARLKTPENWWQKLRRRLLNELNGDQTNIFSDKYLNQTGDIYLDGYWQSPLFFAEIRATLLDEFTLKSPLSENGEMVLRQINSSNSVSIHIRRGDYAKNLVVKKQFGVCSLAYYESAITKIESTVNDPKFFIFSDDIDWVKNNLKLGSEAVFVSPLINLDAEELILMSRCQHNIIANSSFSWWGAWLNQNPNKIVVSPTPWFNKSPYDKNLIPADWIQLPK